MFAGFGWSENCWTKQKLVEIQRKLKPQKSLLSTFLRTVSSRLILREDGVLFVFSCETNGSLLVEVVVVGQWMMM